RPFDSTQVRPVQLSHFRRGDPGVAHSNTGEDEARHARRPRLPEGGAAQMTPTSTLIKKGNNDRTRRRPRTGPIHVHADSRGQTACCASSIKEDATMAENGSPN